MAESDMVKRRTWVTALALGLMAAGAHGVAAAEIVRIANAAPQSFFFTALQVGKQKGIFAAAGLEIRDVDVFGGAKGQQAMAANSVDFDLGAGPELASVVKSGVPVGIAAITEKPGLIVLVVNRDGARTLTDLKGKSLGVSTAASLTDWLAHELARRQGWGGDGVRTVALGAEAGQLAGRRQKQIDGVLVDLGTGYRLEQSGQGRILARFSDIVPDFIIHVLYARRDFVAANPALTRTFVRAWFDTVAYMKTHRADSVAIAARTLNLPPEIAARVYDELMPLFSADGRFPPAGLRALSRSFVETGTLESEPDMTKLITEDYLPPRKTTQ